MKEKIKYIAIVLLAALTFSCGKNGDTPEPDPPAPPTPSVVKTTVLVYMAASNSLGVQKNDSMDIREMQQAAIAGHLNGGRLIIYHAGYNTPATLSEIKSNGKIERLAEYGDDGLSSVHAARMKQVIADARTAAPSENFGLVLWSHGDGWLQNGIDDNTIGSGAVNTDPAAMVSKPLVYGWGMENSKKMKISTLASVLEQSQPIDFVYFDCCYMASVEVAYQMRNATPYIVGSVIELPAEGMPYHKSLQYFYKSAGPDLVGAANATFTHFDEMRGEDRTCAMSVIKTAALENLAEKTHNLLAVSGTTPHDGYNPQRFMTSSTCYFFDMADWCKYNLAADYPEYTDQWQRAFDDVVIFSKSTPYLWNRVSLERCNGLSTLIVYNTNQYNWDGYNTLDWYKNVINPLF